MEQNKAKKNLRVDVQHSRAYENRKRINVKKILSFWNKKNQEPIKQ